MTEEVSAFLKRGEDNILKMAAEYRKSSMPKLSEEKFALFEQTGNRIIYEKDYFKRRSYLMTAGMSALIGNVDIGWLEAVLLDICSEECWALPAHVDRVKNPEWRITVDLFAAETAHTLSEIITLLKDRLSDEIYERVSSDVRRRVLDPFCNSKFPYSWWETAENNWAAVCAGSVGCAAIYLLKEEKKRLNACLMRVKSALNCYLSGFAEDGVCSEGIGYFTYGMAYFTGFARLLYEHTKGSEDLLQNDKVKRIAAFCSACFFKDGLTASFSDTSKRSTFSLGLMSCLYDYFKERGSKEVSVELPPIKNACEIGDEECSRFMLTYRDYFWTKEYLKKYAELERTNSKTYFFDKSEWYLAHGTFGAGFGCKGGNNGEAHNHNDLGSFFYLKGKDMFLADLGAGEYTKQYFSDGRYDILCNRSLGHSVPLINGTEQCVGALHCCNSFFLENGCLKLELSGAYSDGLITSFIRTCDFNTEIGTLKITDLFVPSDKTKSITENLVTQCKPVLKTGGICLEGKEGSCEIRIPFDVSITESEFVNHAGRSEAVWLIQWSVPIVEPIESSLFVSIIC